MWLGPVRCPPYLRVGGCGVGLRVIGAEQRVPVPVGWQLVPVQVVDRLVDRCR